MSTLASVDIRAKLYDWLTQRIVYHSLFWFTLLMLLTLLESVQDGFLFSLSNQLINIFFYAVIVYFNLFYLIPNYLTKKKFLTYGLLLVLFTIIVTPLKVIVFFFKFEGQPDLQVDLQADLNLHFLFTFLIVGASTIVKIVRDWAQHLRERQELETQTMQSELRFLKSQINPHFLFNTLNNLYALTLKKSDQAPEIVIKLSEMMRYMLYECNEKRVPLRKEVNYIRNYLDLEQLRQGKNIDIHFAVEGQVSDQEIAPLMFIPFLENSFKHGLSNHITKGFVNMKLVVQEQCIDFYIENSKPENPPIRDPNRRSGGIGLVNIHRRLNLLYPDNYELKINDMPHAYAVHLKIKLD